MQKALKEHFPLLIITLLYMVSYIVLSVYVSNQHPEFNYRPLSTILLYILQFYFAAGVFLSLFLLVYCLGFFISNFGQKSFWRPLVVTFKEKYLSRQQIYGSIIIFLLLPVFLAYVAMYKQLIPFVKPFAWDKTFMHLDYVLHFHHHPWQLLQPIVGYPAITALLGRIYALWFFVLAATVFWQANTLERFYRMQFFLSFLFLWIILGTFLAYYLSSAGPCFYSMTADDAQNPYLPLMHYLAAKGPAWVINLQSALYTHLMDSTLVFGGGVSAMPSMHISMATLCFLICTKHSKWLGLLALIYVILIFVASVHLAWHYAVDGYVACILTLLIWYCIGKVMRYVDRKQLAKNT